MSHTSPVSRRQAGASVLAGSALLRLSLALPLGGLLWAAVMWAWGA